jgi:hypothetical protein
MHRTPASRIARALATPALLIALCVPLWAHAQSGEVTFSGPSVARLSEGAEFGGRGFSPSSAVSISVTLPSGAEASYGAVVGADGTLKYTIAPSVAGNHTLKVLDSGGRQLASLIFIAIN